MPGKQSARIPEAFRRILFHKAGGEGNLLCCRRDESFKLPEGDLRLLGRSEIERVILLNRGMAFALPTLARDTAI